MRPWLFLLGGLIVWTVHFFLLYGIASVWPGSDLARWLALAATVPALGANAWLLWTSTSRGKKGGDDLQRWLLNLTALGAALSFLAVIWQALPSVIS